MLADFALIETDPCYPVESQCPCDRTAATPELSDDPPCLLPANVDMETCAWFSHRQQNIFCNDYHTLIQVLMSHKNTYVIVTEVLLTYLFAFYVAISYAKICTRIRFVSFRFDDFDMVEVPGSSATLVVMTNVDFCWPSNLTRRNLECVHL